MAKRIALLLSVVVSVYVFFALSRAAALLRFDNPLVKTLGVSVVLLTVLGAYLVFRELRFGFKTAELGRVINERELPTKSMDTDELDAYLVKAIERAEAEPENWTNWYCVALGYHVHTDRKLARDSMRYAVELYEKTPKIRS